MVNASTVHFFRSDLFGSDYRPMNKLFPVFISDNYYNLVPSKYQTKSYKKFIKKVHSIFVKIYETFTI